MLIDSHAHLTSSIILQDLEATLSRAKIAGIEKIINIATDQTSLEEGLKLRASYPWIYHAAAVHPHDADKENTIYFQFLKENVEHLVAIGETGLDYFYAHSPKERQQASLRQHFLLAQKVNLPVVIHCREAFGDFFKILEEFPHIKGVLHCFTGNLEEAKQVIAHGFYLSLSGIVTFKKSKALQEIAKWVPKERLIVETDAPYLAPQSQRGKPNEPAFIMETAQFLADLRGETFKDFAQQTTVNAEQLFNLNLKT